MQYYFDLKSCLREISSTIITNLGFIQLYYNMCLFHMFDGRKILLYK